MELFVFIPSKETYTTNELRENKVQLLSKKP